MLVFAIFGALLGTLTGLAGWVFFDVTLGQAFLTYLGMSFGGMVLGAVLMMARHSERTAPVQKKTRTASAS